MDNRTAEKKRILDAIAALAKRLGRAPSLTEFVAGARMSKHRVFRFFPRWNDAVRATGLEPIRLKVQAEDKELLEDWGQMARKKRRMPTRHEYRRRGKHDARTLEQRFGGWTSVPQAFRRFAKGRQEWADVVALFPDCAARGSVSPYERRRARGNAASLFPLPTKHLQHALLRGRPAYGNPTNFLGLRHEPTNEQGVILLFGMVANDLGYRIEAVQKGFPDCEAMRQVAPERWQRVNIEFEFESKNYRDHGHPVTGCDVIVCWRHNWNTCPPHIEILELSTLIKSFRTSAD